MEVANALLNLGGDNRTQVQKFHITPAETAVLRFIHGSDSLVDLKVAGTVDRKSAVERDRLIRTYGKSEEGVWRCKAIDALFPGMGAVLPERFDDLPDTAPTEEIEEVEEVFTPIPVAEKPAKGKSRKVKDPEPEAATETEEVFN